MCLEKLAVLSLEALVHCMEKQRFSPMPEREGLSAAAMMSFPAHPRANVKEGYFERTNMEAPS